MGHYRQWLHYRGIDQLLRSQLAAAEHEVKQLQVQVDVLGKHDFSPGNTIFRALIKKLHQEQYTQWEPAPVPEHTPPKTVDVLPPVKAVEETTSIISPALLAWGQLPNFDTQAIQSPEAHNPTHKQELPPPGSNEAPLPTDISTPVDTPNSPNAQTKIPWWLHNIDPSSQELLATHPGDQQSAHTDYVVQRWFERWGKQSMDAKRSQEDQRE